MLGISKNTFYRRVKRGEIVMHKIGSISLVKRENLEKFFEAIKIHRPGSHPPTRPPTLAWDRET